MTIWIKVERITFQRKIAIHREGHLMEANMKKVCARALDTRYKSMYC